MADDEQKKGRNDEPEDASRRKFLKNSGVAAGGVAGGLVLGGLFSQFGSEESGDGGGEDGVAGQLQEARMFFRRREDFETLAYATERIYPADDNGPGAIELGVPYFIDKQLAGYWGSNAKTYMGAPFDPSKSDTHGLQTKFNRGDIFIQGLRKMQEVSQNEYGDAFINLEGEQQDEILQAFESGDIEMKGMNAGTFFAALRATTIEGVYADPVYGGNKNMEGWKMIGYPGPRMGWTNEIESKEFLEKEPMSLREYQGGNF